VIYIFGALGLYHYFVLPIIFVIFVIKRIFSKESNFCRLRHVVPPDHYGTAICWGGHRAAPHCGLRVPRVLLPVRLRRTTDNREPVHRVRLVFSKQSNL